MSLYLSHLRLSDSPPMQAVASLLSPAGDGARCSAHHKLVWAAFSDAPDRQRDFLWRAMGKRDFLTLSARPPVQTDLFQPHEVKDFAPCLARGETVEFLLRANATRMKKEGRNRVDVVMDALYALPPDKRRRERLSVATREAEAWLMRQGEQAGFHPQSVTVEHYRTEVLPDARGRTRGRPQFGILDLKGTLRVDDPDRLVGKLEAGFGRAKAFGCGLMLIRRA